MLLNARFAALVIFCGVTVDPLYFLGTTGVHAAVIARNAQRDNVDDHSNGVDQKQSHFSFPWSHKNNHTSSKHKVRMVDNSFGPPFVNALLTYLQHRKGLQRRSKQSLVVPDAHGHKYVVNHSKRGATTPTWMAYPGNNTSFNSTASADPAEVKNMTGIVQLMSGSEKDSKVIAFLAVGNHNNTQVLDATGNKSEAATMSLSSAPSNPSCPQSLADNDLLVYLCEMGLCATYNPYDLYDQEIELQPLFADPSKSNKSQTFTFSQASNRLTPVSCMGGDNASQKANSASSSMDSPSNSTSASSSSIPQPSSASQRRRDSSASSSSAAVQAQNVTLVFVPSKGVNNNAVDIKADSSTSTVTHTVTSTIYSSAYPSPSGPNVAALSVSVSVSATPSSPSAMASPTPSGKASGMNVELVGNEASSSNVPSSSASNASSSGFAKVAGASSVQAISSSASGAFGAASVTASPSPSAPFNAAAVAASLASSYRTAAQYTASDASASASGSGSAFGVASASAMASAQPAGQSVLVAAAWRREAEEAGPTMAIVNTEPYTWKFSRE